MGKYSDLYKRCEKAGIRWNPWIGEHYDKTEILILGLGAYYKKKEENQSWVKKFKEADRRSVNQEIIQAHGLKLSGARPFKPFSRMFLNRAKIPNADSCSAHSFFWNSVAFANFCQYLSLGNEYPHKDKAREALKAMLCILQPKVCIAWSTTTNYGLSSGRNTYIYMPVTRNIRHLCVSTSPHLIMAIPHPSWYMNFYPDCVIRFLCEVPECKDDIRVFLDYLKKNAPK